MLQAVLRYGTLYTMFTKGDGLAGKSSNPVSIYGMVIVEIEWEDYNYIQSVDTGHWTVRYNVILSGKSYSVDLNFTNSLNVSKRWMYSLCFSTKMNPSEVHAFLTALLLTRSRAL